MACEGKLFGDKLFLWGVGFFENHDFILGCPNLPTGLMFGACCPCEQWEGSKPVPIAAAVLSKAQQPRPPLATEGLMEVDRRPKAVGACRWVLWLSSSLPQPYLATVL